MTEWTFYSFLNILVLLKEQRGPPLSRGRQKCDVKFMGSTMLRYSPSKNQYPISGNRKNFPKIEQSSISEWFLKKFSYILVVLKVQRGPPPSGLGGQGKSIWRKVYGL